MRLIWKGKFNIDNLMKLKSITVAYQIMIAFFAKLIRHLLW